MTSIEKVMERLKGKMKMEELIAQITKRLPAIDSGDRFVLGIDGLSRSGKTTLTAKMMEHYKRENIPVISFHLDDLIVERERRYGTGEEEWYEYYQLQWETDWLREHFFKRLKNANELTLPLYDGETDQRENRKVEIPESCIIIIEGVFLQRRVGRRKFGRLFATKQRSDAGARFLVSSTYPLLESGRLLRSDGRTANPRGFHRTELAASEPE